MYSPYRMERIRAYYREKRERDRLRAAEANEPKVDVLTTSNRTYQPAISGEKIIDPGTGKTIATINYNGSSDAPALRVSIIPPGSRHPEIKLTNARINLLIETFERLRPLVVQTETYRLEDDTEKLKQKIEKAKADIAQAQIDLERAKQARAEMIDQVGLFVPAQEA